MHFSTFFTPVMALMATAVSATPIERRAVTADQVVTTLKNITQQSQSLSTVASGISPQNGVPLLGATGSSGAPTFNNLISGFQGIIATGNQAVTDMQGTQPYTDTAAEQAVCDAFSNFVKVHQNLLRTVIGKAGLLNSIFLGPVAAVLRQLEDTVDNLSFGIIDSVPVCEDKATQEKNSLDDTLNKAICAYTPAGTLGLNLFC